jgi:hypothetical protein
LKPTNGALDRGPDHKQKLVIRLDCIDRPDQTTGILRRMRIQLAVGVFATQHHKQCLEVDQQARFVRSAAHQRNRKTPLRKSQGQSLPSALKGLSKPYIWPASDKYSSFGPASMRVTRQPPRDTGLSCGSIVEMVLSYVSERDPKLRQHRNPGQRDTLQSFC